MPAYAVERLHRVLNIFEMLIEDVLLDEIDSLEQLGADLAAKFPFIFHVNVIFADCVHLSAREWVISCALGCLQTFGLLVQTFAAEILGICRWIEQHR